MVGFPPLGDLTRNDPYYWPETPASNML